MIFVSPTYRLAKHTFLLSLYLYSISWTIALLCLSSSSSTCVEGRRVFGDSFSASVASPFFRGIEIARAVGGRRLRRRGPTPPPPKVVRLPGEKPPGEDSDDDDKRDGRRSATTTAETRGRTNDEDGRLPRRGPSGFTTFTTPDGTPVRAVSASARGGSPSPGPGGAAASNGARGKSPPLGAPAPARGLADEVLMSIPSRARDGIGEPSKGSRHGSRSPSVPVESEAMPVTLPLARYKLSQYNRDNNADHHDAAQPNPISRCASATPTPRKITSRDPFAEEDSSDPVKNIEERVGILRKENPAKNHICELTVARGSENEFSQLMRVGSKIILMSRTRTGLEDAFVKLDLTLSMRDLTDPRVNKRTRDDVEEMMKGIRLSFVTLLENYVGGSCSAPNMYTKVEPRLVASHAVLLQFFAPLPGFRSGDSGSKKPGRVVTVLHALWALRILEYQEAVEAERKRQARRGTEDQKAAKWLEKLQAEHPVMSEKERQKRFREHIAALRRDEASSEREGHFTSHDSRHPPITTCSDNGAGHHNDRHRDQENTFPQRVFSAQYDRSELCRMRGGARSVADRREEDEVFSGSSPLLRGFSNPLVPGLRQSLARNGKLKAALANKEFWAEHLEHTIDTFYDQVNWHLRRLPGFDPLEIQQRIQQTYQTLDEYLPGGKRYNGNLEYRATIDRGPRRSGGSGGGGGYPYPIPSGRI
ncbi:unnamed protein product [Amoebophrya sp. A25]|nr:unnamed protein product [Amoebophrya sp. A25]|eukprot:GSA25T00019325001.1